MKEEDKKITGYALECVLKQGAEAARINLAKGLSNSIEVCDGKLEKIIGAADKSLGIEIFCNGHYGRFSTNMLDEHKLDNFIKECVSTLEFVEKDRFRRLPEEKYYFKGQSRDFGINDSSFELTSPERKKEIAFAIFEEMKGKEGLISASSSFSDLYYSEYILDSQGFSGLSEYTSSTVSAECTLKDGDRRPQSYWYASSPFFKDLEWKGCGEKAYRRAKAKTGSRTIASGKYRVKIDTLVAQNMIKPLAEALSGVFLAQNNSFLLDRLGSKVFSSKLSILDLAVMQGRTSSRLWDSEGLEVRDCLMIDKGVVAKEYLSTYEAAQMGKEPTVDEPTILSIKPFGNANLADGILITGFNGGNCNTATGDFSYGIEGFLIENNEVITAVSGMNFSGNLVTLFNNICAAGNDALEFRNWDIPSLVFEDCNINGN